jgi:hypothetical protein
MPPVSATRSVSAKMRILSRAVNVRRLGRSDNSGDADVVAAGSPGPPRSGPRGIRARPGTVSMPQRPERAIGLFRAP